MSIITISRGSYSRGKEIAEKVAQELGYECIGREVLLEASEQFNVPEIKLVRAIHDAPSILSNLTYGKERYISYIQSALLKNLQRDNIVYHGLAGHFFLKGVSHVLKVRIIADMEARVREEMKREGISEKDAMRILKSDDEERRKWSHHLYGIDTTDSGLYDLVLHIRKIRVNDAVDIICHTVGLEHLRTTPESQRAMDDMVLAAEVKAVLVDTVSDIETSCQNGVVHVSTKADESQEAELTRKIQNIAESVAGVKEIKIHILPLVPYGD
jgi:cytidylate kinase